MVAGQRESVSTMGLVGLGVMGRQLALNLLEHGVPTRVWNLETGPLEAFLRENAVPHLSGDVSLEGFVAGLSRPRTILLMITAGAPVDALLERLLPLLAPEDVVIDGGNSWYEDTERRSARCASLGISFVGMGVSGGEEGARRGPSLMPGGPAAAWTLLSPMLERIAAQADSGPCVTHVGTGGAGHFVKMVHNGIEYAEMQLLAEAYDLLRRGLGLEASRIADVFARWNEGPAGSFLLEISERVLRRIDPETGLPLVELVLDRAGQKGTGRWTVEVGLRLGVPVPSMAAAVDARVLSSLKDERVAASALLGGPAVARLDDAEAARFVGSLHEAIHAARLATWAQGLRLISVASIAHGWGVELAEVLRIWRAGCIIRAKLLGPLREAVLAQPDLVNLLVAPGIAPVLTAQLPSLRRVLSEAILRGLPTPVLGASLAYVDSYRTAVLPQNLTQAQRDAFGAHTYQRVDAPELGALHTEW